MAEPSSVAPDPAQEVLAQTESERTEAIATATRLDDSLQLARADHALGQLSTQQLTKAEKDASVAQAQVTALDQTLQALRFRATTHQRERQHDALRHRQQCVEAFAERHKDQYQPQMLQAIDALAQVVHGFTEDIRQTGVDTGLVRSMSYVLQLRTFEQAFTDTLARALAPSMPPLKDKVSSFRGATLAQVLHALPDALHQYLRVQQQQERHDHDHDDG